MKYQVEIAGKRYHLNVQNQYSKLQLLHDGKPVQFDYEKIHPSGLYSLVLFGKQYRVWVEKNSESSYKVSVNHETLEVELNDERQLLKKTIGKDESHDSGVMIVRAPIPGLVLDIVVEIDQEVNKGDGLIIMEAMKMENEIKSPGKGKVSKILVKKGDAIDKGLVLIELTSK